MATDKPRFSVTFTDDSFAKIRKYQKDNHIVTQSKAVSRLVELAINSIEEANNIRESLLPSPEAQQLARDYDCLDLHGQRVLRMLADEEKARCFHLPRTEEAKLYIMPCYFSAMSAGTGEIAASEYPEDYILKKRPPRGASYIAPVHGDSMEPTIHDGDKLFIRACTEIRPGKIGVFFMEGKMWVKELGDGVLISHNKNYDPIPMTEGILCEGEVLGVCDESYF